MQIRKRATPRENLSSGKSKPVCKATENTYGQFHVRDLFLGKLNRDDDFAERLLNPRFKSISRA